MKIKKTCTVLDFITLTCLNFVLITSTFSKAATDSLVTAAILFWLVRKIIGKISKTEKNSLIPNTPLNTPILIYTIACILSIFNSTNIQTSLVSFFGKILENILLFFVVVDTLNTKKRINFAIFTLLISLTALIMDCGFQYFTGKDLFRHFAMNDDNRLKASFSNSNDLAGWLILTVPVFIFLAFFKNWAKPIIKKLLIILIFLVMACLILTHSRAALIAIFFSCFIFSLSLKKKAIVLLIFPLITLLILAFSPLNSTFSFNFLKGRGAVSVNSRIDLWKKAVKMIADYPILGAGPGTYVSLIDRYSNDPIPNTSYPHNSFLHMATEIGLLGLAAYLWILFKLFKIIFKQSKTSIANDQKYILLGLSAGLMAFLIQSFFDTNLFSLQLVITFWLLVGIVQSILRVEEKRV